MCCIAQVIGASGRPVLARDILLPVTCRKHPAGRYGDIRGSFLQNLIDEFRKYRWSSPSRAQDDPKEKPVKVDDHLLDALRYVVASRPITPLPEEEESQLTPMEAAMRRDMAPLPKTHIPRTPYGGVYA